MFNVVVGFIADQNYMGDWEAAKQISTTPTLLRSIDVTNKNASTIWIQLYNSASGASGVPFGEYPLPTNLTLSITDRRFPAGLYVRAVSSQGGSLLGTSDIKICCGYETRPIL